MAHGSIKWLFLVFALCPSAAGAAPLLRQMQPLADEPAYDCLPHTEYALAGVPLGAPAEAAAALVGGPPPIVSQGFGEDDGGLYLERVYLYPGLAAHLVRGVVDRLSATGSDVTTPGGLRPGLTREEVATLLWGSAEGHVVPEIGLTPCDSPMEDYFELKFDAAGRLESVAMESSRP